MNARRVDCHENTKTRKPILFRAFVLSWLISCPAVAQPVKAALAEGVTAKDVKFFSEAVQCYAKIYMPKGFTAESKAPAVVVAPAPGDTSASVDKYAAQLAARGLVAMTIDYRGWGKSGGFLYLSEPVRWDDRLRFSQHTAKVRIRRKRLMPDAQILDIRNAISFLQGEPGVDRARIGLWGADLAGGHVVTTAAIDVRVKAAVAQTPIIAGKDVARRATAPSAQHQAEMVRLARKGQAPATPVAAAAMND
jgi:dienelactone hydrolase